MGGDFSEKRIFCIVGPGFCANLPVNQEVPHVDNRIVRWLASNAFDQDWTVASASSSDGFLRNAVQGHGIVGINGDSGSSG
jgi:hypothetical protein